MTENDLFNRDTMYWRDINYSSPTATAEVELFEPFLIDGDEYSVIKGRILPFESRVVEYAMENGGAFTKNEVTAWPFVLIDDLDFYLDKENPDEDRNSRVHKILHANVKSIKLRDKSNTTIAHKAKI